MSRQMVHEHEISGWNPMSDDYNNPNFNSYAQGPGSRLERKLQPCYARYVCVDFM
jgi:hypothetical protein